MVSKNVIKVEVNMLNKNNEKGFSLIELLLVVVIIGIIAALAVPALQRALSAAERGTTFATMRTISSTQVGFFSQNNRFGRLIELQTVLNNALGTTVVDSVVRGKYTFEMTPPTPTDAELSNQYVISATRALPGEPVYRFELTESGKILQVSPAGVIED